MKAELAIVGFWYNIDRALASLMGAPWQETMSSQIGRRANGSLGHHGRWFFKLCSAGLSLIQKDHCQLAIIHADKLKEIT